MAAQPPLSTGSINRTARGRRPDLSPTAPSLTNEGIYDVYLSFQPQIWCLVEGFPLSAKPSAEV